MSYTDHDIIAVLLKSERTGNNVRSFYFVSLVTNTTLYDIL